MPWAICKKKKAVINELAIHHIKVITLRCYKFNECIIIWFKDLISRIKLMIDNNISCIEAGLLIFHIVFELGRNINIPKSNLLFFLFTAYHIYKIKCIYKALMFLWVLSLSEWFASIWFIHVCIKLYHSEIYSGSASNTLFFCSNINVVKKNLIYDSVLNAINFTVFNIYI